MFENGTFWSLVVAKCAGTALIGGFAVFVPKYLKTMFDMVQSESGYIVGMRRIFILSVSLTVLNFQVPVLPYAPCSDSRTAPFCNASCV